MPDTQSLVSRNPNYCPPWRQSWVQEGVQRESPSKGCQSGLGKQQMPERGRGERGQGVGCPHSWLRFGWAFYWSLADSGGPLQRAEGALQCDLCHVPLAKDQSGSKWGLASE